METRAVIEDGPFAFAEGPAPADAGNWAFIGSHSRTGSNLWARLLSLHPDCQIGQEDGGPFALMTLFTTRYFFVEGRDCLAINASMRAGRVFSRAEVRMMCEAWRSICGGGAAIVGDKQRQLWFCREAVREVFPGCHFITTIRHPLDQLASACAYNPTISAWSAAQKLSYLQEHCDDFGCAPTEGGVSTVRFEDLGKAKTRVAVLVEQWERMGLKASPQLVRAVGSTRYDAPAGTIGRWRSDRHVAVVMQVGADRIAASVEAAGYRL